jgi:predicted secreted protein
MIINVKRQNSIKTADYFEILNSIDNSEISEIMSKNVCDGGIVVNPGFTSELYNKKNNEKIYLKAAAIRFLSENKIYIVLNETHTKCTDIAKKNFKDFKFKYERGFVTNTNNFVNCEDAVFIIKNYKKNNNHLPEEIFYKIEISDNIKFFKNNILLFETNYIEKNKLNKHLLILDLSCIFYSDELKEKNDPQYKKFKKWHMFIEKNKIILSEKYREFTFIKKKRIILDII